MKPITERKLNGGVQKIYRFKNDYGASVVRHSFSYTNGGEWELAVIYFDSADNESFSLSYSTPITDEVLGHLTDADVERTLKKIKALAN